MADTTIEFEIQYLKGEIKSMHKAGLLVSSKTYERLHKLEKKLARAKRDSVINATEKVINAKNVALQGENRMKVETVIEVVEKLIGDVEAWGETNHDEDAYINLGLMKGVCDALLIDIYESSKTKNRHEYSMKKVGKSAYMYLNDLRDWLDDILGEIE